MDLQFKKIETEDLEVMMPYYQMRRNRTCDSVFLESFIWKDFYNVQYAVWEDRAILWLMEYGGKCFSAMPLCREEDLPAAFQALETYFNEVLGFPLVINLADEYAVEALKLPEDKYHIAEQIDSKDYLYLGESLRTLAGKKLHKKKNHLNSFIRNYGERTEYRPLCCSDSHLVWRFLDDWSMTKGADVEEHLEYEVRGIHDILKNCSNLNIRMGGVFIDDQLEAFTIGSYNPVEDMAVIHIEKANPQINGLYQYINQQFLLHEFPEVEWVNREDDLGLEGLRKAKMSYNPADFARKYLVQQIMNGKSSYSWAANIGNTMAGDSLNYTAGIESEETKGLWRMCFPEDSEDFLTYYYTEKTKDNRLMVKKQNGFLTAMTHLNPYKVQVKNQQWDIDYLVGVATDPQQRHKGHMRDILMQVMKDMNGKQVPFTFLMPAAKEIYEPFLFTYICDRQEWILNEEWQSSLRQIVLQDTPEDCQLAAEYMEQWLSERYDVYCIRDEAYVSRLLKELASEQGQMSALYNGDELAGLRAEWGIDKKEQRLLYTKERYCTAGEPKPSIMARITSVVRFLQAFTLQKDGPVDSLELRLEVSDSLLLDNQGVFLWTVGRELSEAVRAEGDASAVLQLSVRELAVWLFGYRKPSEIWPELDKETLASLELVDTAKQVLIDEVV